MRSKITSLKKNETAGQFEAIISQLQEQLNDKDQELLANDLEITNLPEGNGDNPLHLVCLIGKKLGLQIDERDIVCAERVGARFPRNGGGGGGGGAGRAERVRPRPLIVRLARRALRDEILRSMRVRRGADSADFGLTDESRPFYVNERLTKYNRTLLYKVREARRCKLWAFVWIKRGRIYVKQAEGKPTFIIRTENDLNRVFGINTV